MQQLRTSIAPADWPRTVQHGPKMISLNANPARQSAKLTGWKEIGNFVGQGVRTVQRWETELGLPVHRIRNSPRSPVFAFKSELDWWLRKRVLNNSDTEPPMLRTNCTIREARLLRTRCRSLRVDMRQQLQSLIHNLDALRMLTGKSPRVFSMLDSGRWRHTDGERSSELFSGQAS